MGPEVVNRNKNCTFNGPYAGRDLYITMLKDTEREFVVTHNANIRPVSYFTGRETELGELRQRIIQGRKSVLVSGMGGIGKTHICRKLFWEYLDQHEKGEKGYFDHLGYVEYNGNIVSSLQKCLKYKKQESLEQDREAVWRELEYLAKDGKVLLFVDNVNVSVGEDDGLERLKGIPGAIVLTSRRASFSREFESYRIGFLGTKQCREIYEKIRFDGTGKKVKEDEVSDLEYVIDNLAARHTITIEFLAHLAWTKTWSVKRLRKELEQNGFCLEYMDEEDKLVNIQKSYESLYDLSNLSIAEQNILEAFSVFPYTPLSVGVCNQWLLSDAGVGEDADILVGLYRKGWIQFELEQESYTMHPVFAKFIYGKCQTELKNHMGLLKACETSLNILESGSAKECQNYLPFAENIVEKVMTENPIDKRGLINSIASLQKNNGNYRKAERYYEMILNLVIEHLGEKHLNTAVIYNNLALVYEKQGEYQKAEELYIKMIQIMEKELGTRHPDMASGYTNMAGVYAHQGEYKKAEELYRKALQIRKKIPGVEHLDIASSFNGLADVYVYSGKYQEAEELYIEAIRIMEEVIGEEHRDMAGAYHNLASVYVHQGEFQKAEALHRKVIRIRKKVIGDEHPDMASSYGNLASVYAHQGEYQKAEELFFKSLQITEKVLGKEHPTTASFYHNLANVYFSQGEYQKAERLYRKALRIREKKLGEEHPYTVSIYQNLACVYYNQGEYGYALEYFFRAFMIFIFKLGSKHPNTKMAYNGMKLVYPKLNQNGDFERWLEQKMKETN